MSHESAESWIHPPPTLPELTEEEQATYEWQIWSPGFGEEGQRKLKGSRVLISRCGGLGGVVAYELAAAGMGHLVIAHAGNVKHSDLNRQLLMTYDHLGKPRAESIRRRLRELNPHINVTTIPENMSQENAERIIRDVDVVVDAAPLFEERYAMNDACVRQGKPMVETAMYDLEAQVTTIVPGRTPCLRCLVPEKPDWWKRQFPVFGAVSGTVGCVAAMEAIKLIAGLGEPLLGRQLVIDLRTNMFKTLKIHRDPACPTCGHLPV